MISIKIVYCRPCKFQPRAVKLADELLSLGPSIDSITLVPGSGGVFDVFINDELVFSRHREGRFPETSEVLAKLLEATNGNRA